ncbi:hypothetical protein RHGRI_025213 [Rhododendron griersonianum]|uniref:Uncharacterized protein n=1 Tax=Rhododendron griersonianum TaxID=479676 RepID=A0AAV6JA86_9ERIC|nr:hypothetical protein RHGRI_025213 [Rhododendron griersonianum]
MEFEASKQRMKKSPIYQQYEGGDYGFDPQVDFLQFLEEARNNTSKDNYDDTTQYPEEAQNRQSDEVKKNRKSWKKSLFSWWNAGKKSNSSMVAPTSNSYIPKPKRSLTASGPISGSGGSTSCRFRRQTSGPLKSVFHLTNEVEDEIPYMCLDKLDNPHGVQSYGPVYLVT